MTYRSHCNARPASNCTTGGAEMRGLRKATEQLKIKAASVDGNESRLAALANACGTPTPPVQPPRRCFKTPPAPAGFFLPPQLAAFVTLVDSHSAGFRPISIS